MNAPFKKVLIANRGTIAQRIARTCKDLGYHVTMIYAENDLHLPLLTLADEIKCCDYLDQVRLIELAKASGAAIHPGYGFLSERSDFAEACSAAGVNFIGPSAPVLALTGLKHACAAILKETNVPLLPCVSLASETAQNVANVLDACAHLSFPVMVKPSAAGGGVGMQWVEQQEMLAEAVNNAAEMGLHYFQCGDVLVQQALKKARHIEVQLLADHYGRIRAVGDRECSLQRRRQKVIETSLAELSDQMRQKLYAYAEAVGHAIQLDQVATVEFLWDEDTFWFLEVNPRLQVEHGVSEALNQTDIVACQLAFEQGDSLEQVLAGWPQNYGYSMQARIYAEDPQTGLPASGQITCLELPTGQGIRLESGIYVGMQVSMDYDPLLMKVIAHGATREQCRQRLLRALTTLVLQGRSGFKTNQQKLIEVVASECFKNNTYHTRTLESSFVKEAPCSERVSEVSEGIAQSIGALVEPISFVSNHAYQNWKPSHWT